MKNLLVAQSGGPTSAINATLAGVVENALSSPSVDKIYGSINGIQGVLTENLVDLKAKITNVSELDLLCQTPASALGSCRVKLKDPAVCADEYETIISVLRKYNIDCFIYIGGNDSMDTVDKLSKYLNAKGITDITVVGAPKTIDNDLCGTDHCMILAVMNNLLNLIGVPPFLREAFKGIIVIGAVLLQKKEKAS